MRAASSFDEAGTMSPNKEKYSSSIFPYLDMERKPESAHEANPHVHRRYIYSLDRQWLPI